MRRWPTVPVVEGPPSTYNRSCLVPSQRSAKPSSPWSADVPSPTAGSTTTAPAPSPNSTQVALSCQSSRRENTSAPITSTVRAWPDRINASVMDNA